MLKSFTNSRKSSPSRTPVKKQQSKLQALLDPSRLRPPQMTTPGELNDAVSSNNRINLSLGVNIPIPQDDFENENEILSIAQYHQGADSGISTIHNSNNFTKE